MSTKALMRYARAVKQRPRIEVPSARDDELALRSLIATSVACLAAGLLLAYATADDREDTHASSAPDQHELAPSASAGAAEPPPPTMPPTTQGTAAEVAPAEVAPLAVAPAELAPIAVASAEVTPAAAAMPDPPIATPDAGPAIAAATTVPEPAVPEPAVIEPAVPEPAVPEPAVIEPEIAAPATAIGEISSSPPPNPAARKLKIKPGVVAYLRCDGLAQRRGPIPCPRDRALETRMREIIETLPNCREAHAISRGSFEVRLEHIATGAVRDLMVKAPNEAADRAVRACAGAALRKARTELKPQRMIVSMRFKAR